jgi:hypothetical protein
MSHSGESQLINRGTVKSDGLEKSYSILFDDEGVTGVEVPTDRAGKPEGDPFTIPWTDIRAVTRKGGLSTRVLQRCGFTVAGEDTFRDIDGEPGSEFVMVLQAQNSCAKEGT